MSGTPVSIVSIPHTGTKFVEYVLLEMGCDVRHAHFHARGEQDPRPWFEAGAKIVVPFRKPEKAAESARKRGEEPRPSAEWDELLALCDRPSVHLFNVEPCCKKSELASLARFVGADVPVIDWTPRNAWVPA